MANNNSDYFNKDNKEECKKPNLYKQPAAFKSGEDNKLKNISSYLPNFTGKAGNNPIGCGEGLGFYVKVPGNRTTADLNQTSSSSKSLLDRAKSKTQAWKKVPPKLKTPFELYYAIIRNVFTIVFITNIIFFLLKAHIYKALIFSVFFSLFYFCYYYLHTDIRFIKKTRVVKRLMYKDRKAIRGQYEYIMIEDYVPHEKIRTWEMESWETYCVILLNIIFLAIMFYWYCG